MLLRTTLFALLPSLAMAATALADEAALFPFVVSHDAPANVTNIASWLDAPAGKHGFMRIEKGHFVDDRGPVRFWATNFSIQACFPEHEQAEQVAARLARLGVNCVRLHHMDGYVIWQGSPNKTIINADMLDKVDYLVYQLKKHGIYVNLNLHVSRWLGDAEGFPHQQERPKYDKGLGNFEPRMIELQKKYARDLLTHVNPYTKLAYVDEPAVAMVEISNEDSLFSIWSGGKLDNLPEPYAGTFRALWNAWLKKKYGTTDKLRTAWKSGEYPLGDEILTGGDFSSGKLDKAWHMERDDQTKYEVTVGDEGPNGQKCLRIAVESNGRVTWRPQLVQAGFAVEKGTPYTLSFAIKCDKKCTPRVNCIMAHQPWSGLGLTARVDATTEWTHQNFTFIAKDDDTNARVTFTDLKPGVYELADVSLRPGGIVGLQPGESLQEGNLPVLRRTQLNQTEAARCDFIDFLWDTERDYWWGMEDFLKDELKVRVPISGTQLSYSPAYVQARLDYIDAHSYWNHPHFPNRPWDRKDWYVSNRALVNYPAGTLGGLAGRRVLGMAYTVSEYNHPAPNHYAAEGFPMIAAFGGFQGWDGVFTYTYGHSTTYTPDKITGFFDVMGDTSRLVHLPACAAMFLRGDVATARKMIAVPVSPQGERENIYEALSAWKVNAAGLGLDERWSIVHAIGMQLEGKSPQLAKTTDELPEPLEDRQVFVSDTGQIRWDVSEPDHGVFSVDSPRSKLLTGFVCGKTVKLGGVELKVGTTRLGAATITMFCVDGRGFDQPGRILIAATGWTQNTGWQQRPYVEGNDEKITLDANWGAGPVLCEGVPATVRLPVAANRVTFYPLDPSGARRSAVACGQIEGQAALPLEPKHRTVWYEVVVE